MIFLLEVQSVEEAEFIFLLTLSDLLLIMTTPSVCCSKVNTTLLMSLTHNMNIQDRIHAIQVILHYT